MGVPAVRPVLVAVALVLGFAAMILGLVGDGATALAAFALGVALCNTAALVPPADET